MSERSSDRDELAAAVEARRELGRDYEDAVLDSFLDRLDKSIDARVDARVEAQTRGRLPQPAPAPRPEAKQGQDRQFTLGLVSLGAGIPISAIVGSGSEGSVGRLLIAWAGIVGVNVAHALSRRRD